MNIYFVIVILLTSLHSSTQLKQHTARARVEDVPAYCATILYKVSQSDEQALECYNVTSGMTGFRRCSQLGGYQYAFARALPLASPNDSSLVAYFTSLAKEALDDVARNRDWVVSHQPGIRHARPFSLPPDEPEMPKLHDVHPSAYGLCTPPEITTMIDRINRMNEIEQEKYKINLATSEREKLHSSREQPFLSYPENFSEFIDRMNKIKKEEYAFGLATSEREKLHPSRERTFLSYPENFSELSLLYNTTRPLFAKATLLEVFTQTLERIKTNWVAQQSFWGDARFVPSTILSNDLSRSRRSSTHGSSAGKPPYSSDTHLLIVQSIYDDNTLPLFMNILLQIFLPTADIYCSNTWTLNHSSTIPTCHRYPLAHRWQKGCTYMLIPHAEITRFMDVFKFSIDYSALEPVNVDDVMPVVPDEECALFSPAPSSVTASAAFSGDCDDKESGLFSPAASSDSASAAFSNCGNNSFLVVARDLSAGFMSPPGNTNISCDNQTPPESTSAAKRLDFLDDDDTINPLDLSFTLKAPGDLLDDE